MKVNIESVEQVLLERKLDQSQVLSIIKELEQEVQEEKEERDANKEDKSRWEYVIVLNDKENYLKDKEIAGWVVQQEENADASAILSKLCDAAKNQNEAAKRKKSLIKSLVELFEGLKPKFTKEKKVRIKTKELTRVIITNGNLV